MFRILLFFLAVSIPQVLTAQFSNKKPPEIPELGKPTLLYFTAKWCGPCRWMEKEVFTDQEVSSILDENFYSYKVNVDKSANNDLLTKFSVGPIPRFIMIDDQGETIRDHNSKMTLDETLKFLDPESDFEDSGPRTRFSTLEEVNHFIGASLQTSYSLSSQSTLGTFGFGGGFRYLYRSRNVFISPTFDWVRQTEEGDGFLTRKFSTEFGIKLFPSTIYEFSGSTYLFVAPSYGFQSNNSTSSSGPGFRYGLTLLLGDDSILGASLGHEISRMRLVDSMQNVQFINLGFFMVIGVDR